MVPPASARGTASASSSGLFPNSSSNGANGMGQFDMGEMQKLRQLNGELEQRLRTAVLGS